MENRESPHGLKWIPLMSSHQLLVSQKADPTMPKPLIYSREAEIQTHLFICPYMCLTPPDVYILIHFLKITLQARKQQKYICRSNLASRSLICNCWHRGVISEHLVITDSAILVCQEPRETCERPLIKPRQLEPGMAWRGLLVNLSWINWSLTLSVSGDVIL